MCALTGGSLLLVVSFFSFVVTGRGCPFRHSSLCHASVHLTIAISKVWNNSCPFRTRCSFVVAPLLLTSVWPFGHTVSWFKTRSILGVNITLYETLITATPEATTYMLIKAYNGDYLFGITISLLFHRSWQTCPDLYCPYHHHWWHSIIHSILPNSKRYHSWLTIKFVE